MLLSSHAACMSTKTVVIFLLHCSPRLASLITLLYTAGVAGVVVDFRYSLNLLRGDIAHPDILQQLYSTQERENRADNSRTTQPNRRTSCSNGWISPHRTRLCSGAPKSTSNNSPSLPYTIYTRESRKIIDVNNEINSGSVVLTS